MNKRLYIVPEAELIPVHIEAVMTTLSAQTGNYDESNNRPINTAESHDENHDGQDDEEATAKRWSVGLWEW